MTSRALALALAVISWAGCSDYTVLIVDVKNPQGLPVASEDVTFKLATPSGQTMTKEHLFNVNGNLGTFSARFPQSTRGRLTLTIAPRDPSSVATGRATAQVQLTGQSSVKLTVTLARRLAGVSGGLLGGVPGGTGNRDGATGPASALNARLEHPLAFAFLDGYGYVLERCALRRIKPTSAMGALTVDTPVPCRAPPPGAPPTSGTLADLALAAPVAMAADPASHRLIISDGPRLIAIAIPQAMQDAPPAMLAYGDLGAQSGKMPQRAAGLALGPYRDQLRDGPFSTLYVADRDANLVYAYPLAGGAPTVAAGAGGACVTPLPAAEARTTVANPIPPVPAAQAHLCAPTKLEVGQIAADASPPMLLIVDSGHGAIRMFDPASGVTTLYDGLPDITAVGYKFVSNPLGIPISAGLVAFVAANQFGYYTIYASTSLGPFRQGSSSLLVNDGQPGYTESLDLLSSLGTKAPGAVRFDDVEQIYRPLSNYIGDPVLGNFQLGIVQSGNAVVQGVSGGFHISPVYGTGPHRGVDSANLANGPAAAFRRPAGLAWDGASALFVADDENHTVARLAFNAARSPLQGEQVSLVAGCPGSPGWFDGAAASSRLRNPRALAWDAAGRALYVADTGNAQLRRIAFDAGGAPLDVHTLFSADGASSAECDGGGLDAAVPSGSFAGAPRAVTFDAMRRVLWLADGKMPQLASFAVDAGAPQLQVVPLPPASGPAIGVAIVGDRVFAVDAAGALSAADAGAATSAAPIATLALAPGTHAAAFGSDGEWLYLADDAARLWRIDPFTDAPALEQPALAGDGIFGVDLDRAPPGLNHPTGLAYDGLAGVLLVSDGEENSVVMIQ